MSQQSQPPRWLEAPEDAPSAFQHAAAAYGQLGPSEATRVHTLERLRSHLARRVAAGLVLRVITVGVGLLALGAGLIMALRAPPAMNLRVHPRATVVTGATTSSEAPAGFATVKPEYTPEPAPASQPDEPAAPDAASRVTSASGPARARRRPGHAPRDTPAAAPAANAAADPPLTAAAPIDALGLRAELQLLMRARRTVHSAPSRALELSAEHAVRFVHGAFVEEREVIAIEALLALGRRDEAAARGQQFVQRYPDSAHRHRVAEALAAP